MSDAVTRGIRVQVQSHYVPARSAPQRNYYFFAYDVTISNEGDTPVQLVSRYWSIVDGIGHEEEVSGPGVVGETPHLLPGESFEYTSFCPLNTPMGTMQGNYDFITDSGEKIVAEIAPFVLAMPHAIN